MLWMLEGSNRLFILLWKHWKTSRLCMLGRNSRLCVFQTWTRALECLQTLSRMSCQAAVTECLLQFTDCNLPFAISGLLFNFGSVYAGLLLPKNQRYKNLKIRIQNLTAEPPKTSVCCSFCGCLRDLRISEKNSNPSTQIILHFLCKFGLLLPPNFTVSLSKKNLRADAKLHF